MKAIFTTAYWPPVACFAALFPDGEWVLEQHEHYQKQTIRNRCSICGANGPQWLIVPVILKHGFKTPIREVMLDLSENWQRIHWLAIESAYRSSPYYEYYREEIRPFFTIGESMPLFEYNTAILRWCAGAVESCISISYTESYKASYKENDFRHHVPAYKAIPYYQVFARKHGFVPGQSILDLLMNEGPEAWKVLKAKTKGEQDPELR